MLSSGQAQLMKIIDCIYRFWQLPSIENRLDHEPDFQCKKINRKDTTFSELYQLFLLNLLHLEKHQKIISAFMLTDF